MKIDFKDADVVYRFDSYEAIIRHEETVYHAERQVGRLYWEHLVPVGQVLPNGIQVFNATPHPIRFWKEGWDAPVEVESHAVISARISEIDAGKCSDPEFSLVSTEFVPNEEGNGIIQDALLYGSDVIIGSIIAAQAYPGRVLAMCPAPGYERVSPSEKRMLPDKFTVFE